MSQERASTMFLARGCCLNFIVTGDESTKNFMNEQKGLKMEEQSVNDEILSGQRPTLPTKSHIRQGLSLDQRKAADYVVHGCYTFGYQIWIRRMPQCMMTLRVGERCTAKSGQNGHRNSLLIYTSIRMFQDVL